MNLGGTIQPIRVSLLMPHIHILTYKTAPKVLTHSGINCMSRNLT